MTVTGALVGGLGSVGVILAARQLVAPRRPTLESRVAPYIRDVPSRAPLWSPASPSDNPVDAARELVRPVISGAAGRMQRIIGGRAALERRLARLGGATTVEQFRLSQVVWALSSFAAVLLVGVLGPARDPGRALPWFLLSIGAAGLGAMARDSRLSSQIAERERRVLAEFPAIADLLALSVAAGEGPMSSLDRVVSTSSGPLVEELQRVLADARTGRPIGDALDALASRTGVPVVARFAQAMAIAISRGTPLVDVLAAQAADVREAARRALIESGSRKEVLMMAPVVFLCLPVTLVFAFYPGIVGLDLVAS